MAARIHQAYPAVNQHVQMSRRKETRQFFSLSLSPGQSVNQFYLFPATGLLAGSKMGAEQITGRPGDSDVVGTPPCLLRPSSPELHSALVLTDRKRFGPGSGLCPTSGLPIQLRLPGS